MSYRGAFTDHVGRAALLAGRVGLLLEGRNLTTLPVCPCGKPVKARGMCRACYARWYRAETGYKSTAHVKAHRENPENLARDRERTALWKLEHRLAELRERASA